MRTAVAVISLLVAGSALGSDACQVRIPASLKNALTNVFPRFRTPVVTDNLREDIEYSRLHGGAGCLTVASGDFDGDGKSDFVVGLTARNGPGALIVVALASRSKWRMKVLNEWKDYRARLYVATEQPGVYVRTPSIDGPLANGEVETLECRNALPAFGLTESTEVAYCYAGGKWPYVWVSD